MVYDTYNYSIHGVYKPTYNWGGSQCMSSCLLNAPSHCDNQRFTDNHWTMFFLLIPSISPSFAPHWTYKTGLGDYDFLSFCSKKEMCSKYLKVLGFQSIFQLTIPQYSTATNSGCLFLPSVEHGAATRCWTVAPHRRDSQRYLPAIVRWLAQYVAKWVWRCIVKYVIFHDYIYILYILKGSE